jgi:hypothetical protein
MIGPVLKEMGWTTRTYRVTRTQDLSEEPRRLLARDDNGTISDAFSHTQYFQSKSQRSNAAPRAPGRRKSKQATSSTYS